MTPRAPAGLAKNGASLYATRSWRHGRGVFAARRFRKGQILERCPILSVSARDQAVIARTPLSSYLYERDGGAAIALGLGSLYNHSSEPNAECELLVDEDTAVFRALRAIQPGEEITIWYADESDLWFNPRDGDDRAPANGACRASTRRQQGKKRTALLHRLKAVLRRRQSQPISQVIEAMNPILRGWGHYFAFGHASRCFAYVRRWVEKKIRRHLARAGKRRGFGWKRWRSRWLYETLGLLKDYHVTYRPSGKGVALLL